MDLGLKGAGAVVVGGSRGIGRAIADAFGREGADVALLDIDPAVAGEASALAAVHGVRGLGLSADVTDFASLQRAADQIGGHLGRCDHIVNAAAIGSGKYGFPFWDLEPSDWPRVLAVNVQGAANVAHAFGPRLARQKAGTLLFVASIAGQIGSPTDPPYSAAKAAVINLMQVCARDLAAFGVRANAVSPGMVRTDLNRSVWAAWAAKQPAEKRQAYEAWAAEKIARIVPLGRWQEAEDVADMAVFLASPRAKNVTGQTINVDGGTVMHS